MERQVEDNRNTTNIGTLERLASGMIGAWMVGRWLARLSPTGLILAGTGVALVYRAATGRSRLYRKLHISGSASERRPSASIPYQTGVKVQAAVTVVRPPDELYRFWRNPENLPNFMEQVQAVTQTGANRSHWLAQGPLGRTVEWDAEVINDQSNALISWQSLPGSQIANAGSVSFTSRKDGRATRVKLVLEYKPVGGPLGAVAAALLGKNPRHQIVRDLRRFKQLMEVDVVDRLHSASRAQNR